jgi:PPK2 family polyphosphate:nucleotide phosphotransferase
MKLFLVSPGSKVDLSRWDPNDTSALPGVTKEGSVAMLEAVRGRLRQLQSMLIAQRKRKVLVLFQAMDAGGKDGTVRNVFSGLDPHGLSVVSFKAPTAAELEHDFLWRVHPHVPARGEITIFNRSHYEDVVAVRVRKLAPKEVWERRFEHIVNFERLIVDEGTLLLKFFLHIDQAEQKARLEGRLKDSTKRWKLLPSDLADRSRWDEFTRAYEDALSRTSTPDAPWYVIPANKKWFRNLAVATILRDALADLDLDFPPIHPDLANIQSV